MDLVQEQGEGEGGSHEEGRVSEYLLKGGPIFLLANRVFQSGVTILLLICPVFLVFPQVLKCAAADWCVAPLTVGEFPSQGWRS